MAFVLVPREEWPNPRSFGVPVACNRSQADGVRVQGEYHVRGSVVCDMSQGSGHGFFGARESIVVRMGRGLHYVDQTPVVFQAEDGQRYTKDLCAECLTADKGAMARPDLSVLKIRSGGKEAAWRSSFLETTWPKW